jgi:O-antigen ligase
VNRGTTSELQSSARKRKSVVSYSPDDSTSSPARSLSVVLAIGICLLLAFEPLALGGVQPWGIAVLEMGVAILVAIWALRAIVAGRLEVYANPLFVPMLLFAALVGLQLVLPHTAYWYVTWQKALLWAAYGIMVFLVAQCFRRASWLQRFGIFLSIFGFLVAVFTIAQQYAGNGKLFWLIANQSGWPFYGPYMDHSHYAGLMELLLPIPLVFAIGGLYKGVPRVLFGFAALIMASTIFLSQSLGGIIAFAAEMVALSILLARRRRGWQQLGLLGLLGALLVLWILTLQPTGLGSRLAKLQDPLQKADTGERLMIVKDSFKMIAHRPVLGWGLGTFPVVYPAYRSFYTNLLVNEAHNDFIQTTVETGLLGGAIMLAFIVLLYRTGLRRIEHWRHDARASMALAALVGCTGLLVHSLSDFNLQIPANAVWFFALAAIASSGRRSEHVR